MKLWVVHDDNPGEEIDILDHYPLARVFAQTRKVASVTVRWDTEDAPTEMTWFRDSPA